MARKNVLKAHKMLDAADLSGSLVSEPTSVINMDKASIVLTWSGAAPEGTIVVEARNGAEDSYKALDFGGQTIAITGNSGDHRLLFNELQFTDIRLSYTATSGTGSMDAIITAKQVGG